MAGTKSGPTASPLSSGRTASAPCCPPDRLDIAISFGATPGTRRATLTGHGGWAARLEHPGEAVTDRAATISGFLTDHGWGAAASTPLAGDASARRYLRLARGDERAILMDSPNPAEDVVPFIAIADILRGLGLSAPEIKAAKPDDGLLLLEDFGDGTFTRLIAQGADTTAILPASRRCAGRDPPRFPAGTSRLHRPAPLRRRPVHRSGHAAGRRLYPRSPGPRPDHRRAHRVGAGMALSGPRRGGNRHVADASGLSRGQPDAAARPPRPRSLRPAGFPERRPRPHQLRSGVAAGRRPPGCPHDPWLPR